MKKYKLLLIDDDPLVLKGIGSSLKAEGYKVTVAENGEKALEILEKKVFDVVITDKVMGDVDGLQILKTVKKSNPETIVIILTGHEDLQSTIHALRLHADDYLLKPCQADELAYRLKKCLEKYKLNKKNKIYEEILSVCCVCKKIRDDTGKEHGTGDWKSLETYIQDRAGLMISHSLCPDCLKKYEKELDGK
jgi:YesN/AraC family two-component response regulator